jgi:predicted ABC-type ATPase
MPGLYIITGSNGAGKSTVGPAYLPINIQENYTVFDGDLLFTKKLSELFPSKIASPKYARKEALQYVIDLFEEQTKSAIDT